MCNKNVCIQRKEFGKRTPSLTFYSLSEPQCPGRRDEPHFPFFFMLFEFDDYHVPWDTYARTSLFYGQRGSPPQPPVERHGCEVPEFCSGSWQDLSQLIP